MLSIWTLLWGSAPLWVSIPATIAIALFLWWVWDEVQHSDYDYKGRRIGRRY